MLLPRDPPPLGPPDFNPASLTGGLGRVIAGSAVPLVLATIFILARCYSRTFLIGYWGWDDRLIVLAWLCAVTNITLGWKVADLPITNPTTSDIIFAQSLLYQFCISVTKLSILCSYLRILPRSIYRKLTWLTIYVILCAATILLILSSLACDRAKGHPFHPQSVTCVEFTGILISSSVVHCVVDVWLIVLIVPFISTLSIPRKQKIALKVILSSGVLAIVANISRVVILTHVFQFFAFAVWSSLELCVGLFCASAPATLPLLRKLMPAYMRRLMGADSYHNHGDGVSTQLSRIRQRGQAVELGSRDEPVEKQSGSRTMQSTRSTERRSSGTPTLSQPWLVAAAEPDMEPQTARRGSRNHIVTGVDEDGTMRVTGGVTLDDVVSEGSEEGSNSRNTSVDAGSSKGIVAEAEEKSHNPVVEHDAGHNVEYRSGGQDIGHAA